MEAVMQRHLVSFLCFQGFIGLCLTAWIPTTVGDLNTERNQNELFHNVETGQKLTHDDSGMLVPLDNILDPVVALPTDNTSHHAEPDCATGSSLSELDLCLSPAQAAMFDSWGGHSGRRHKRQESANGFSLWNHGVIPYVFNSTFASADRDAILSAMSEWQKSTCIRFRQSVGGDHDLVVFKDGIRCSTNIGRIGNEQIVTLASNCRSKRILIHELGHVIGLIHEHQRHDRDKYVKVILENVRNVSQERYQFSKLLSESLTEKMVNYDYTSIMHYGRNYFAKTPDLTTLQSTDSLYQDVIGRAEKPSLSDIETVNRLYHCPDQKLYRNNPLDSTCEFFARRGDCAASSMKDTVGHLCIKACRLYQLQLNTRVPAVTSTRVPTSSKKPQSNLVAVLWGSNSNALQSSGKPNNSSNHYTMLTNVQNISSSGTTVPPINTQPSNWPGHQKGTRQSYLQGQRHLPRSLVPLVTFPQQQTRRNTTNLFISRNLRTQKLQTLNTTRDASLHQRPILNNSTKARTSRNQTRAQAGTIRWQQKRRLDNRNFRHFIARNTRTPSVRQEILHHQKQNISLRVLPYGIHSQPGVSNNLRKQRRHILQPASRHTQPFENPYDIASFIEFVIARQLRDSQDNSGTKTGNNRNMHNSGMVDIKPRHFAVNCQSSSCDPNPWKRTNQYNTNKNVPTTGETDKLNNGHLVLTDLTGPEFGLIINHRTSNINYNIKSDTVLINEHSIQEASLPFLIKSDITSQNMPNVGHSSSSRYSMEPGFSVPWDPPSQDLTLVTHSSSGQPHENDGPGHVLQSIDSFVTNTELVPQSQSL